MKKWLFEEKILGILLLLALGACAASLTAENLSVAVEVDKPSVWLSNTSKE